MINEKEKEKKNDFFFIIHKTWLARRRSFRSTLTLFIKTCRRRYTTTRSFLHFFFFIQTNINHQSSIYKNHTIALSFYLNHILHGCSLNCFFFFSLLKCISYSHTYILLWLIVAYLHSVFLLFFESTRNEKCREK